MASAATSLLSSSAKPGEHGLREDPEEIGGKWSQGENQLFNLIYARVTLVLDELRPLRQDQMSLMAQELHLIDEVQNLSLR